MLLMWASFILISSVCLKMRCKILLKLILMLIQEKKYKEYLSQEYEPVDESKMPFLVDIRAIRAYADSKGVGIVSLSDEEKQQFMIPNPRYQKKHRHGIAAVF